VLSLSNLSRRICLIGIQISFDIERVRAKRVFDLHGELSQPFSGTRFLGERALLQLFRHRIYAQPRMTRDIDVVVSLNETQTEEFFRLFEREYYFDRQTVARAISQRRMFNLIHNNAVIKVDCVVLKTDAYRQEEFARRRQIDLGDFKTWIVSREDLILSKLFWAKDSKSEMQLRDVRNLLSTDCDIDYVRSRAKILRVDELLQEILVNE